MVGMEAKISREVGGREKGRSKCYRGERESMKEEVRMAKFSELYI